jgi:hypothetical protein
MTHLTLRRLRAMEAAIAAMLAGEEGEGDWPPEIGSADMETAHDWVCEQIEARTAPVRAST